MQLCIDITYCNFTIFPDLILGRSRQNWSLEITEIKPQETKRRLLAWIRPESLGSLQRSPRTLAGWKAEKGGRKRKRWIREERGRGEGTDTTWKWKGRERRLNGELSPKCEIIAPPLLYYCVIMEWTPVLDKSKAILLHWYFFSRTNWSMNYGDILAHEVDIVFYSFNSSLGN